MALGNLWKFPENFFKPKSDIYGNKLLDNLKK